ncbi:DUF2207 domain-containing protein [Microbacterium oleivorans]|uniref:DUF2207 domain-containing protein n=1 Tax=Microbacterium oleivorans TaxID=273677 RepID=A0A7D5F4K4_9MICO|nr:DUF2207 domain-containing protein [Microbacterium oleivorans]QLD11327.1 DUF2207 domain-containing protein [Microbacterium oleivorans]
MIRRTRSALALVVVSVIGCLLLWALPSAASAASSTSAPITTTVPPALRGVVASDVSGDLDAFVFDSLAVDYTITRDADGTARMRVVETFVADFPDADQNRGMRRLLPETYNGQPLHPELVSVTDEDGRAWPVETDSDDGTFGILARGDDYLHGRTSFVFTYDLENVVWSFPDTGLEFYWDVNGTDWEQPFGEVSATVHLDAALAQSLAGRQACYVGGDGATDACPDITASADGSIITAKANDLGPRETLTVAIGFDEGAFETFDSSFASSPFGWLQAGGAILLLGATGWAVRNRRTLLRHEPGRATIIAEYEPPPGVDALESAVLLGKTTKAIPAEVLEQAVAGSIRIVEGDKPRWGKAKLRAELVDPSLADGDGRMLLGGLFPAGRPGDVYEFGSTDTRFSTAAQKILKTAGDELKQRGMYRSVPVGARAWPLAVWGLAVALVVVFGVLALTSYVHPALPIALLVVAFLSFFVVIFAIAAVPLSTRGAEVRDHLAGLKTFIAWAEEDRIRTLQSPRGAERRAIDTDDPRQMLHLYERLLPYAVVFGLEKEWSQRLVALYAAAGVAAPVWYAGSGAFDPSSFAAGIGTLSASASSSSSTSGGSSGGGAAGGGGGGGGGGGA